MTVPGFFPQLLLVLSLQLLPPGEPPARRFAQAADWFDQGLFVQAETAFEEVASNLEASPQLREEAEAFLIRIDMMLDPGTIDAGLEMFSMRYPESSHGSELFVEAGDLRRRQERHMDAYDYFDAALDFPATRHQKARISYWKAESAASAGDTDLAIKDFLILADDYPRTEEAPNALYASGRLHLERDAFDEAAAVFQRLSDTYPVHPVTQRIGTALGESYYQQEQYALAAEALTRALPFLDKENADKAVYLTAESYNALGQYKEAIRYYLQYINSTEGSGQERLAHIGLGWVYHRQAIYHWAAESFAKAAAGDARDDLARKALYYAAVNQKLAGRYDQAIASFRTFTDFYQEGLFSEEGAFEHAVAAFEMGLYGESIEVLLPLARRLETLKRPGEVLTFLGEAYFANGEYTRALQTFELAEGRITLPEEVKIQARFQKGWVQYSNQAYAQAQPVFEAVVRQHPDAKLAAEALFWSADSYFQIRSYGQAARQFAEFLQRHPNHEFAGAAAYALAWSHFMAGDFAEVIEPMTRFLERYDPPPIALFPYDTDARLRLGDAFYALGRYEEAVEAYLKVYGADPGGDYAMFQVANSYYRMNRNADAIEEFRKLLRIYPFTFVREQARYNIGYIFLTTEDHDRAVAEYEGLIRMVPGSEWAARAQFAIGDAYYNAGRFEEAAGAYEKVLQDYPRSPYVIEAINGIQYAQLSAGEDDRSTELLEAFLDSHPSSTTADRLRFRQAQNRMQAGDYTGAVKEFEQYIRISNLQDRIPDAYIGIADARMRLGDPQGARAAWTSLVEAFPESEQAASALASLGRSSFEAGEMQASLEYFERLGGMGPRHAQDASVGMGLALLAMGDIDKADERFGSVLKAQPANLAALNGQAQVLLAKGRFDEARESLKGPASRGISEAGAEAQVLIARSYRLEGRHEEALQEYARVRVLYEAFNAWVAQSLYESMAIHILEGRTGTARGILDELTTSFAGTPAAAQAKRLLEGVE
jgi:tetratricopeptide (TPR) repeat protein